MDVLNNYLSPKKGSLSALRRNSTIIGFIIVLALIYSISITRFPYPQYLAILFGFPLLVLIWYNMRLGIIIWLILSALGNRLEIDLPGIPPLRTAHLILIALIGVWVIKSYKEIPSSISRFLFTRKNQLFMILLGWISLSMVMGRITHVTKYEFEYQFNAWISFFLVISLSWFISNHFKKDLLKWFIIVYVIFSTVLNAAILITGFFSKVGILDWKTHYYDFFAKTGIIGFGSLFLSVLFFRDQKIWGKVLFLFNIVASFSLIILEIIGGSRSDLSFFVFLGFLIFWTRPRKLFTIAALIALSIITLNSPLIKEWLKNQTVYTISDKRVISGPGTRIALALDAIQIIQKYPIWGTGSDFYRPYSNVYLYRPETKEFVAGTSAHNMWLQAAVDHGVPAAILLAFFIGFLFRDTVRLYQRIHDLFYKKIVLFFLVSLSTIIIFSPFGESIMPVFTASDGNEAAQLAHFMLGFWLFYGFFLGIEKVSMIETS